MLLNQWNSRKMKTNNRFGLVIAGCIKYKKPKLASCVYETNRWTNSQTSSYWHQSICIYICISFIAPPHPHSRPLCSIPDHHLITNIPITSLYFVLFKNNIFILSLCRLHTLFEDVICTSWYKLYIYICMCCS